MEVKNETWPIWSKYIVEGYQSVYDYLAWIIGIRMYGDIARKELQKIDIIGWFDLLDAIASN